MRALILVCAVLAGCSKPPISNDNIIEGTKKCEAAGLNAEILYAGWNSKAVGVGCRPKNTKCEQ